MRKNGPRLESTRAAVGWEATRRLTYRRQSHLFYTQRGVVSAGAPWIETDYACVVEELDNKMWF